MPYITVFIMHMLIFNTFYPIYCVNVKKIADY